MWALNTGSVSSVHTTEGADAWITDLFPLTGAVPPTQKSPTTRKQNIIAKKHQNTKLANCWPTTPSQIQIIAKQTSWPHQIRNPKKLSHFKILTSTITCLTTMSDNTSDTVWKTYLSKRLRIYVPNDPSMWSLDRSGQKWGISLMVALTASHLLKMDVFFF